MTTTITTTTSMTTLINLTPHRVTLLLAGEGNEVLSTLPPDISGPARVEENAEPAGSIMAPSQWSGGQGGRVRTGSGDESAVPLVQESFPCVRRTRSTIVGLPSPAPDTAYVVSGVVAEEAWRDGRRDVIAPAGFVRNGVGHITGCTAFAVHPDGFRAGEPGLEPKPFHILLEGLKIVVVPGATSGSDARVRAIAGGVPRHAIIGYVRPGDSPLDPAAANLWRLPAGYTTSSVVSEYFGSHPERGGGDKHLIVAYPTEIDPSAVRLEHGERSDTVHGVHSGTLYVLDTHEGTWSLYGDSDTEWRG